MAINSAPWLSWTQSYTFSEKIKEFLESRKSKILAPESEKTKPEVCSQDECTVAIKPPSRVWCFVTPWAVAHQGPLSMGFLRLEYRRGCHFLLQGDLPDPGIKPVPPALAGRFFTAEPPGWVHKSSQSVLKWF